MRVPHNLQWAAQQHARSNDAGRVGHSLACDVAPFSIPTNNQRQNAEGCTECGTGFAAWQTFPRYRTCVLRVQCAALLHLDSAFKRVASLRRSSSTTKHGSGCLSRSAHAPHRTCGPCSGEHARAFARLHLNNLSLHAMAGFASLCCTSFILSPVSPVSKA